MKKNSEEYCQIFVASFLKKLQAIDNGFLWWHTPNGGKRNKQEAARLKMMGVLAGVLDITILSKNETFFIELKLENGALSQPQKDFIKSIESMGYDYYVVYADTPESMVNQVSKIMQNKMGYQNTVISSCVISALSFLEKS